MNERKEEDERDEMKRITSWRYEDELQKDISTTLKIFQVIDNVTFGETIKDEVLTKLNFDS